MSGNWGFNGHTPPPFLPSSRERVVVEPRMVTASEVARIFDVPLRLLVGSYPGDTILPSPEWRRRRRLWRWFR